MSKMEDKQFVKHSLEALCFRAKEAIFVEKGVKGSQSYRFQVPDSFIHKDQQEIAKRHSKEKSSSCHVLQIKELEKMPDLEFLKLLQRDELFSIYIPKHQSIAVKLMYVLNDLKDARQLISLLVYLHDICNPYLYNYVLSVMVVHWKENLDFIMPDHFQLFPEHFISGGSYNKAMEAAIVEPSEVRSSIEIDDHFTSDSRDPEQLLSYFREDISLNLYHLTFHQVYPNDGPIDIVAKPRRGEIFFYVYRQILARYNFARMAAGLSRVKRLNNFYEPIPEVCFQKLNTRTASRNWPGRFKNCIMSDIDREVDDLTSDISGLERWRDRIIEAIDSGYVIKVSQIIYKHKAAL